MSIKEDAQVTLDAAYKIALEEPGFICDYKDFIDAIIDNTHLTYKYVLFTELLAKATDESINPLCLQKKSELPGSYDARTVCHRVIVPFEMETLNKVLGGSNEPFLNKPARFPELDKSNAVRRGNDRRLLNLLCDTLPQIKTKDVAFDCLVYLLCKLIKLKEEKQSLTVFSIEPSSNLPSRLYAYILKALESSYEGETLTLMAAGAYHLAYNSEDYIVEVHPVNQAGASRKEISDLDIYHNDCLLTSNELKDKEYSETDVRHAADKVLQSGGDRMLFVEGPHGKPESVFIEKIQNEYLDRNFLLSVINYKLLFASLISQTEKIDVEDFLSFVFTSARDNKFKEDTIQHLDTLAQEHFDLEHSKE